MCSHSQSMNNLYKPSQLNDGKLTVEKYSNYSVYMLPSPPIESTSSKYREFDQDAKAKKINKLNEMCDSIREQIQIEAEIKMREIEATKKKLLDDVDLYLKNKLDQIDQLMINRLKKMSQSIKNGVNKLIQLDDFIDESFIDEEKLEFISNQNLTNIDIGQLKLKSIKRSIDYDTKSFQIVNLSDLFNDDLIQLDVLGIESENGNYFAVFTDMNSESRMFYWNHLKCELNTFKSPKTISFITFMLRNNYLVLNYIHEPTQNYYLRVYEIKSNDNSLVNKSLLNSHDECIESLYLIGIDKTFIYCSSMNGLYVFNFECLLVKQFGQLSKPNETYYFGDNIKQIDIRNNIYYWLNDSSMNITNMNDGKLVCSVKLKADKFDFDSNGKLIVFSKLNQNLLFLSENGNFERVLKLNKFPKITNFFINEHDVLSFLDISNYEMYISLDCIYNDS